MRLKYPLEKIKITQDFGDRSEVYAPYKGHMGIDLKTKWDDSRNGERSVYAAAAGKVELGNQGVYGYGKFIILHHPDGSETIYAHLSKQLVREGEWVVCSQRIGISGNTGFSDAPHLHFGYRPLNYVKNNGFGGYTNPLPYMDTTISAQYFEQVIGRPTIYFYDYQRDKMVPFADGDTFKMFFGDYQNVLIHKVTQLSKPAAEEPLKRI